MGEGGDFFEPSKGLSEKLQNIDWGKVIYEYRFSVLLILIGLIVSGAGAFYFKVGGSTESNEIQVLEASKENEQLQEDIIVEVSGAVKQPGVYSFKIDSRVEDALVAAGGLSDDADMIWFEKMVNRAAKLSDGQKLYIPRVDEHSEDSSANISGGSGGVYGTTSGNNEIGVKMVNINTASQKELEELWGIGPVYAQNIIEQRPYSTVKELLDKKIIKQNVYDRNKELMSVY